MPLIANQPGSLLLGIWLVLAAPAIGAARDAQQQTGPDTNIVVTGERPIDPATLTPGPEIKGVISARHGEKFKVAAADGTSTVIVVVDSTRIKAGGGKFEGSGGAPTADALLNGLPITVKTLQSADGLIASDIRFRNSDYKTAQMIRAGTAQGFDEQTAATEALRGRLGDIDKYNVKSTTNVYFDTGKATLSPQAKAELCAAAAQAETIDNALILVVGYTDSVGTDERNQLLSEKRAGSVTNYLQQACHWKPYRMLTPTGMATADPLASNDTSEGKAQNRRVAVNILVSKGLDGF